VSEFRGFIHVWNGGISGHDLDQDWYEISFKHGKIVPKNNNLGNV